MLKFLSFEQKKIAKLGTREQTGDLIVKVEGKLIPKDDPVPEGYILLTDEQEEKLNNGYYVKDLDTMTLEKIPPHVTTLAEAQAAKTAELKANRDAEEVADINYNGHTFDYDEKARERINAAIIALEVAGTGASIDWTLADNTELTVTASDLKGVIAAVATRSNTLHVKYRELKEKVEACTTVEDVEKIAW